METTSGFRLSHFLSVLKTTGQLDPAAYCWETWSKLFDLSEVECPSL